MGHSNRWTDDLSRLTGLVYFGLGSNVGERLLLLELGLKELRRLAEDGCAEVSPIYETSPWGGARQSPFLNCVARAKVALAPGDLLQAVKRIETAAGRAQDGERWGPRELDVDVLLYGAEIMEAEDITIPHPRITERRFVLQPLCDLAPDLVIPDKGVTVRQALAECTDRGMVRLYGEAGRR